MDTQEVRDLYEAYLRVHQPQELTEEVEIAAQYFYEMGLNEEGVEIVIEELGVEEFAEWVYDIAEDYYLTERKLAAGETTLPARSRERIGGKSAASRKFSDPEKKSTAGGKRRAARAAAREEGQQEETPRQARIRELRAKSATKAIQKQPKKQGLLDRVSGAVNRGLDAAKNKAQKDIETRKKFMSNVRGTVEVAKKAAGKVGEVAKEVGKGASGAVKFAAAVTKEEVEAWVSNLLEEGYDLSEYTWDDMCEMYMNLDEGNRGENETGMSNVSKLKRRQKKFAAGIVHPDEAGELEGERQKAHRSGRYVPTRGSGVREGYNTFDAILEHLVAEGYADTEESALAIMANMSEEWRESIVEDKKYDANRRRAAQRAAARNEARRQGRTGNVPGVGYVSPRPEGETYRDSAGVERGTHGGRVKPQEG